jgi:homoprotocatechuate degradation regulator HpaR
MKPTRPTKRNEPPATTTPAGDAALREFSRSLPMALLRTREAVMARFRPALREHGLTEQQWRVLRALHAQGPLRAIDVSGLTFISMPSLSRLLKTLEERRWLRRQALRQDQRAAHLSLTAAGRRMVANMAPRSEAIYADIAGAVGEAELDHLYSLLESTRASLGDAMPEGALSEDTADD